MHPGDESAPDNAQRTRLPFLGDVAGLHRVPVPEWHTRDKRVSRTLPRTV